MISLIQKNIRGFTLLEVLVSLFIFSVVMMATAQIFGTAYSGHRMTRLVQHDIENAQFAMNVLAKTLRTSTVVSGSGSTPSVKFFDYSQGTEGRCFLYRIEGDALQVASGASTSVADCSTMLLNTFTTVTTGTVSGSFVVIPSAPATRVGKVTISLVIGEMTSVHSARLQTSVSLRDFGYAGLL
jgi:prepilin-type N-terminal cleavage/methylation domain-containing protein